MKRIFTICCIILTLFNMSFAQEAKNDFLAFEQDNGKKRNLHEDYNFSVTYRVEAGYAQDWQNSNNDSYPDAYFHGGRIGATFDFNLPYHFSLQTGLRYQLTYGHNPQHYRSVNNENPREEYLDHKILKHTLTVPVYATYTQKLWRDLALWFYTGPEFAIGVAQYDNITLNVSDATEKWMQDNEIQTESYDKYNTGELARFNMQWGLGGGLQWDKYRLLSGYSFGLNNLVKKQQSIHSNSHMWEWGWFVSFSYAF
ncbi:MAG: PorT family protein [Paludibacter sp.]|nr:PorT family protein [Bacteroidales bacterium]MCM1068525.1 PorT family protein [Prevotella sp.]MCM1353479.1 PorT family protein [Bacteroides sp.]MCM1442640.1 PorT family protein [Muribaculum sp.]MCM1481485.1 PorT family protein [Paludibacter sp.]